MEPFVYPSPLTERPPSPGQPSPRPVPSSVNPPRPTTNDATPESPSAPSSPPVELVIDDARRAILGYTWPGIEDGEPPVPRYSFFEYVESIRSAESLDDFKQIQEQTKEWWSPTLDRGAGALIHFAVDHGRLDMVRYLVEELNVPVNHQSLNGQWTPLHRCARMVHYKHAPYFDIFEYLLAHGADPELECEEGLVALDLVVQTGYQWEAGEVRKRAAALVARYSGVAKGTAFFYTGKSVGEVADRVMSAWRSLPSIYPKKGGRGRAGRLS